MCYTRLPEALRCIIWVGAYTYVYEYVSTYILRIAEMWTNLIINLRYSTYTSIHCWTRYFEIDTSIILYAVQQSRFIYGALKVFCYIMLRLEPNIPSGIPVHRLQSPFYYGFFKQRWHWIFLKLSPIYLRRYYIIFQTRTIYIHNIDKNNKQ